MEIERKFLIHHLPPLENCPCKQIAQSYICVDPVIRIRQLDDTYFLTVKSKGQVARQEFEIAITKDQYNHLQSKSDTLTIKKRRYYIRLNEHLTAELDVYADHLQGLYTVEVEFPSLKAADAFIPPEWFGEDISYDNRYKNNHLAQFGMPH